MPLQCPHCQIAQAEENETCINCGQPLTPAPAAPAATFADPALLAEVPDPLHAVQARRASWRMPALVAVGLLLALVASALLVARRKPPLQGMPTAQAAPAPAPVPSPDTAPPVPTAFPTPPVPPEAVTKPLAQAKTGAKTAAGAEAAAGAKAVIGTTPTVTLVSRSAGRHVQVGDPVTLTAVTEAARGRSATLTLFSRRGRGERTMITFVEGSLCSTNWTTLVPGRYEFTATAQGDSRRTATSRPVEITVDRPAAPAATPDRRMQAPPRVAVAPPTPRSVRLPPLPTVSPKRAARTAPRAEAPARTPAPALTYHVAAAQFAFSRSAVVLADALRLRGYPALPERMTDRRGKTVYVVVTGTFRRPKEARAAALALQRSGYPAYLFGGR